MIWFFTQTEIGQKIITAAGCDPDRLELDVRQGLGRDRRLRCGPRLDRPKGSEAKDWVVQKFNDLVGFVTGLPGRIISAASGLWDGIINAFRSALKLDHPEVEQLRLSWEFTVPVLNKRCHCRSTPPTFLSSATAA
ncbi:hypothetical protein GS432_18725 [Rhodococcus hoagii]|nr:hypothetical protein [Prescottella equi]